MYIENLIESLRALASREFQKVAWFENDLGAMSSFGDDVSDLFDDHNLKDILYEEGVVVISKEVHQLLQELDRITDNIGYDKSESEIIDSPEMEKIRQKSAKILGLIKNNDGSESTVRFVKVGTSDVPITIAEALKEESFVHNIISAAKNSS